MALDPAESPPPVPDTLPRTGTRRTLRRRAIESSVWMLGGDGLGMVIRFGTNIALARLLAPDAFGVMALVATFLVALEMFSDLGLAPSIIQSRRGDDPQFLRTAWTVSVIRGVALWGIAILIAYPISLFWNSELRYLLPVAGAQAAIAGMASVNLQTANRQLAMGRVVMLNAIRQVAAVVVMLTWAYFSPTVWALIGGNLFGHLVRTVLSHFMLPGPRAGFAWEREALHEMFRVGRWIFLSTVLTFLAGQTDKLLFDPLLGAQLLGVYWIASQFVQQVPALTRRLNDSVGFPALAELHRTDRQRFQFRMRQLRLVVVGSTTAMLIVVGVIGPIFMEAVYTDEYRGVGWMIAMLVIGGLAGSVNTSYGSAWLAVGQTFNVMLTVAAQFVCVVACTLVGYYLNGQEGFILGLALVSWLLYPLTMLLAIRSGMWQPAVDLPALAVGAVASGGLLLMYGLEMPV